MLKVFSKKNSKKGFTLIELIVVIAILGILAAILIPRFSGFQDKARSTEAVMHAKQIATAADSLIIEGRTTWQEDDSDVATVMDNGDIVALAGPDVTGTISAGSIDANGRFLFTYTLNKVKSFVVVRASTGEFTVTISAIPEE